MNTKDKNILKETEKAKYELAGRLGKIRVDLGMSQEGLAKELGVSRNTIRNYEEGINNPSLKSLRLYHTELNIDWDYLLDGIDNSPSKLYQEIKLLPPEKREYLQQTLEPLKNCKMHNML